MQQLQTLNSTNNFLTSSLSFFFIATLLVFLTSCGQDFSTTENGINEPSESEMLSHLAALGYDMDLLHFDGDFVIYEDIAIAKENIIADITNPQLEEADEDLPPSVNSRHRGVTIDHALTYGNSVNGLKIWIAPSLLRDIGPKVHQSVFDAVEEYSKIENTSLRMKIVDNQEDADITIASDLDGTIFPETSPFYDVHPYTMLANVAFRGHAGPYVAVDPKWENINYNTIKSAMMHELGHTIGLHHTGTSSGEHIASTPEENTLSIMNPQAINTGEWSAFDKKAIRLYYAKQLSRPTRITASVKNNAVTINYTNPKKTWEPYYWVRVYRYDANNNFEAYEDFQADVNVNGRGAITWENQPAGDYTYRVKGMRYKKDVKSKISGKVTVSSFKSTEL